MKLVVGIGNPGDRYEGTRHNVGFDTVDLLARRCRAEFRKQRFWNSLRSLVRLGDEAVTLVKPLSFVNLTGPVVRKVREDLEIVNEDLMVVVDDFWLPLGRIRVRSQGGHGGHNGLESIARALGPGFPRVRIGIGEPDRGEAVDHVLSRFRSAEREVVDRAIETAADAVTVWATEGIETAMNRYNSPEA